MARYPPEHKAQTRERLLEAARTLFREQGFESASIDTVMAAAGLTRGGFYAHFASKEELVEEVLRIEPGLLRELRAVEPGPDAAERAVAAIGDYLDPGKRDELIGCPLVAHAVDAIRGGDNRRALYGAQVSGFIEQLAALNHPDNRQSGSCAEDDAVVAATLAVGAAILSSAMADAAEADRIETVCLAAIRERLAR
jgi:TetR/AcrR family transcriptional regulator, transcriptional repressor for nem operon